MVIHKTMHPAGLLIAAIVLSSGHIPVFAQGLTHQQLLNNLDALNSSGSRTKPSSIPSLNPGPSLAEQEKENDRIGKSQIGGKLESAEERNLKRREADREK